MNLKFGKHAIESDLIKPRWRLDVEAPVEVANEFLVYLMSCSEGVAAAVVAEKGFSDVAQHLAGRSIITGPPWPRSRHFVPCHLQSDENDGRTCCSRPAPC